MADAMMAASGTANVPYPQSPVLDSGTAAAVLIVNILVPGLGTIIGGVVGKKPLVGRGIAQFLLAIVLVGWVWGVVTGVQCLTNAKRS